MTNTNSYYFSNYCIDVNECATGLDECNTNADCINIPGNYQCQCKSGYTGDGRTCIGT